MPTNVDNPNKVNKQSIVMRWQENSFWFIGRRLYDRSTRNQRKKSYENPGLDSWKHFCYYTTGIIPLPYHAVRFNVEKRQSIGPVSVRVSVRPLLCLSVCLVLHSHVLKVTQQELHLCSQRTFRFCCPRAVALVKLAVVDNFSRMYQLSCDAIGCNKWMNINE